MELKNFRIGVNENGFHFQDPETGVIFTLIKANYERLTIAICSESANQEICQKLHTLLNERLSMAGLEARHNFGDIAIEKCYIAEKQDLFVFDDIASDSIGIRHIKTNKGLALIEVEDEIPIAGFYLTSSYDYEGAVKDFFELCSPSIQVILTGKYNTARIYRTYTLRKIKQDLLKNLADGVYRRCIPKNIQPPQYEVMSDGIRAIWYGGFYEIKINNINDCWYVNNTKSPYPIRNFIYTIEAVKKFPEIKKVFYNYQFQGKYIKISVTQKNANSILKETIRKRIMDLTV